MKLKVFRTAIGFHDAYVAAPSKKAALEAWGAEKDLFAIGAAEIVTDPAQAREPLAAPGKVIRRSRGGLAEQLAAMPARPRARSTSEGKPPPSRKRAPKPAPRRDALDAAEAALSAFEERAEAELAELQAREDRLRREREVLEREHAARARSLEEKLARTRERYERALAKWRDRL